MCPVRAIFLEFTKNALKMRPLRALFFEFTKNSHEMCPLRALSLKFTKSAQKFALFQHHIPCTQKMLDARLPDDRSWSKNRHEIIAVVLPPKSTFLDASFSIFKSFQFTKWLWILSRKGVSRYSYKFGTFDLFLVSSFVFQFVSSNCYDRFHIHFCSIFYKHLNSSRQLLGARL